ncbi:MAG: hypothetical protein AAGF85_02805 [Bacteroidota bacterium]
MRYFIVWLTLALSCTQCTQSQPNPAFTDYDLKKVPYKINDPTKVIPLHYDLEEISGLSHFKKNMLLAVQDEKGKLFFIDRKTGEITKEVKFGKSGDYEGVESLGKQVYVTTSNGTLFSFSQNASEEVKAQSTKTSFSIKNDVEGLGLIQGRLTFLSKASGEINNNGVKGKAAYTFDVKNGEVRSSPLFSFRIKELESFIEGREHFNKIRDFDPSGLAEHPISGDIYIITADHALLVLTSEFKIKEMVKLDRKIYKQPEGICFGPKGRLYIANEGDGARAKLIIIDRIR